MARPLSYYAKKYGVPPRLAEAQMGLESGGSDAATSPKNAVGRMQIHLPSHPEITEAQARDPDFAMDWAMRHMAGLKKKHGSWRLALAAYNAGSGAVEKYGGVPPFKETKSYVETILRKAGVLTTSTPANPGSVVAPTSTRPSAASAVQTLTGEPDLEAATQMGLADLRSGEYDPTKALGDLAATARRAAPEPALEAPPLERPGETAGGAVVTGDDWQDWVIRPAPRQGPSKPHGDEILSFVGRIGKRVGTPLEPWGNESHSLTTVNGTPSAHGPGRAADIPVKGARLKQLGYNALLEAGMSKKEALKAARKGGLYNVNGYQIIFATQIGGDHSDHLHVGLKG